LPHKNRFAPPSALSLWSYRASMFARICILCRHWSCWDSKSAWLTLARSLVGHCYPVQPGI
jgi:hypothetical protein